MKRYVLLIFSLWLALPDTYANDAVRFGWDDQGVAVFVDDVPANEVLSVISSATGIPILLDPANTMRLNGLYRKRTLDELLLDLSPGCVIEYRFDEKLATHVIDRVFSSSKVDEAVKQAQLRTLLIQRNRLEEGIIPPVSKPIRYSGIGAAIQPADDGLGIYLQPLSPDAPAAKAGIQLGDLVTAINGRPIASFTNNIMEMINTIRGPENTEVSFTVRLPDGTVANRVARREVYTFNPLTQ